MKETLVLHGLRWFSAAEFGWHFGVEGHCPDVVAFAVMIKSLWEGLLWLGWKIDFLFLCSVVDKLSERSHHQVFLFRFRLMQISLRHIAD